MRQKGIFLLLFTFGILVFATSSANAQWRYISGNSANSSMGRETFYIGEEKGRFRQIELRVSNAAILIDRAQITFGNGQTRTIYMPRFIGNGGRSGAIDLPGENRAIKYVQIWCRALGKGRRASLSLYGRGRW